MANIKDLLDANETVLWEKLVAKDKPKERHFVITNMRVYKKAADILNKKFPGAPKDFLKVREDILIIERPGIRQISIREKKSLIDKLLKKIIETKDKTGVVQENLEKAKASIEKGEVPKFEFDENTPKETVDKVLKYAKKLSKFLSRNKILLYLHNASSNRSFMTIDRLSKTESDKVTEILEHFEGIAGTAFLPDSLQTPMTQTNWPTANIQDESPEIMRNVISRRPGQIENTQTPNPQYESQEEETYLTPSTFKEEQATCQVIEVSDLTQYEGKKCMYCGNDLGLYHEKIFSCQHCGVFYHESCLNLQMGEGFCLGCNKILLW